jgi:hypothetical protein
MTASTLPRVLVPETELAWDDVAETPNWYKSQQHKREDSGDALKREADLRQERSVGSKVLKGRRQKLSVQGRMTCIQAKKAFQPKVRGTR